MSNEESDLKPFSFSLGAWRFEPTPKLSIISLLLIIILVYLGVWQLSRAQGKRDLYKKVQQKSSELPILLTSINNPSLYKNQFTTVLIDGVFLNQYTFLIDNQYYKHQPGFRVITPMQTPRLEKWILIDRGWIPLDRKRDHLPEIEPIFGVKGIRGFINTLPSGIVLKNDTFVEFPTWPLVLQSVDYKLITQQLHHPVYDFVVQLQSNDLQQYQFPPMEIGIPSSKHVGYALQWFTFAILAFIYYVFASCHRRGDD